MKGGCPVGLPTKHLDVWKMQGGCVHTYKKATFFKFTLVQCHMSSFHLNYIYNQILTMMWIP